MPILDPTRLGIVPCTCGRLSNKIHCPACGSYVIRGINKKNTRTDPTTLVQTEYQVYRCRVCFDIFDDYEWRNECKAPVFETHSTRLANSLHSGDLDEVSKNVKSLPIKGMINKGKPFSAAEIEQATSSQGVHQLRMRLDKQSRQQYLEIYEARWSARDKIKGIDPPHELAQRAEENKNGQ